VSKTYTQATNNPGIAPTPGTDGKTLFARFAKGSGQAPQYSTLAPVPANATAKFVQTFDERAIMQEQPPTAAGGPKGSPTPDTWVSVGRKGEDSLPYLYAPDEVANVRADNQVLVRATPTSSKADNRYATPNKLRMYRDEAGESIR
jgi:hypothetical protein